MSACVGYVNRLLGTWRLSSCTAGAQAVIMMVSSTLCMPCCAAICWVCVAHDHALGCADILVWCPAVRSNIS